MHSETLRCGLLGRTLSHSYSPAIHAQLAGYSYLLYEKEPEELEGFLRSGEFDGLNVTIPYKKTVIPYCAELSDTARAIGAVNTIVRRPDGGFGNEVLFDDSALVLFRIEPDGSLGEVCDVSVNPGTGGKGEHSQVNVDPVSGHIQLVEVLSRLHAVVASPSGELLAVCDKGMDKIYTYRIDRAQGRLLRLNEWTAPEVACFPRYAAFHPAGGVLYVNNENLALLNCFHYDETTGALERFDSVYLLDRDPGPVDGKPVGAQDILVHPNGRTLYCTLCGLNLIVVCRIGNDGAPRPVQHVNARGILPRGLALSPDGRFLLSGNMVSGDVTVFAADGEGLLTDTCRTYPAVSPSALRFLRADN